MLYIQILTDNIATFCPKYKLIENYVICYFIFYKN